MGCKYGIDRWCNSQGPGQCQTSSGCVDRYLYAYFICVWIARLTIHNCHLSVQSVSLSFSLRLCVHTHIFVCLAHGTIYLINVCARSRSLRGCFHLIFHKEFYRILNARFGPFPRDKTAHQGVLAHREEEQKNISLAKLFAYKNAI